MCGILGIKKLPVARTTKSYTSSRHVAACADLVTKSTDHLHRKTSCCLVAAEVALRKLAWIASSLVSRDAWQPVHLPQCHAAHTPKHHISWQFTGPTSTAILACHQFTQKSFLASLAAWLDVISVKAALKSVKYMLAALGAACMYAPCCGVMICTEYLLSATAL